MGSGTVRGSCRPGCRATGREAAGREAAGKEAEGGGPWLRGPCNFADPTQAPGLGPGSRDRSGGAASTWGCLPGGVGPLLGPGLGFREAEAQSCAGCCPGLDGDAGSQPPTSSEASQPVHCLRLFVGDNRGPEDRASLRSATWSGDRPVGFGTCDSLQEWCWLQGRSQPPRPSEAKPGVFCVAGGRAGAEGAPSSVSSARLQAGLPSTSQVASGLVPRPELGGGSRGTGRGCARCPQGPRGQPCPRGQEPRDTPEGLRDALGGRAAPASLVLPATSHSCPEDRPRSASRSAARDTITSRANSDASRGQQSTSAV